MPTVPDLTGHAPGDAFRALRAAGLRPVLLGLPSTSLAGAGYRLAAQDPGPGAQAPAGARVTLAFEPYPLSFGGPIDGPPPAPKGTPVPAVVGLELDEAADTIASARLQPFVFQPSRAVESLTVTRQEPAAGEPVRDLGQVALYLD